jgi:hypothetical protein
VSANLALSSTGSQGAAGHLEVAFALRNLAGHGCTVRGYPRVVLLDSQRRRQAVGVIDGSGFFPDTQLRPRSVVVPPGGSALFSLSFVDAAELARGACVTTTWLEITPPGDAKALEIAAAGGNVSRFAPCGGRLYASPVYAG